MQISEDEISFLTGADDPNDDEVVLKRLFHPNLKLLLVTEGSAGCRYYTKVFLSYFIHIFSLISHENELIMLRAENFTSYG